ncbi:MAG: hypothetical protein BWY56_02021 [Acidobacteria bacterium ADurb.Bin340]|nr:MAG: hypothetical protein BWY56_02021 [Acidobacteria bacterium ADurb.Bin340]
MGARQVRHGGFGGPPTPQEPFQQAGGGQAVGAVQAGAGHFARGEEARQAGATIQVHGHAAAEVVGGGNHGNGLAGGFQALGTAGLDHGGKTGLQVQGAGHRRQVQEDVGFPAGGHFLEDGPGHHIPGGQFHVLGIHGAHEALALAVDQMGAFAPQGFGEQGAGLVGDVEGGGVELEVLAVHDAGAGPVGRGKAIPRGAGGVAGVQVEVAQAAGCQDGAPGHDPLHRAGGVVQQEGAPDLDGIVDAARVQAVVGHGEQVHQGVAFQHPDARMGPQGLGEGALDRPSGGVLHVVDAPGGMGRFGGDGRLAFICEIEGHTQALPQEVHAELGPLLRQEAHRFGAAQAGTGGFDVCGELVRRISEALRRFSHNAALGIGGVGFPQGILGHHQHFGPQVRRPEGCGASGDAGAQHKDIHGHGNHSHSGRGRVQRGA